MTRDQWQRVKTIAADAWEQPPSTRAGFVDAACAGDESLRGEVARLLQSTDAAAELYEAPVLASEGIAAALLEVSRIGPPLVDTCIGPYRIRRELGHGGMGRVYLAERVDGAFDQRVAIKFVGGLPTEALLRRFDDERRILATLDHPNIARLMDGGATADGHPYVIMEYVAGVPIDEFSDAHHLGITARVELFLRVCDAVQYAHQRLVIHRDVKPRNILVTSDGTPKLLDFGIAKLLDEGRAAGEPTRTMFRVMTPETASPEQIRGEPVTTATDVYALGGLLYRLLVGQMPYELESCANDAEWMRVICEQIPLPPSKNAKSLDGVCASESKPIDKDLDLIVLKALRKEPERRYATVKELSDDLRRFLDGRPVHAAPDDRAYRLRKFTGRHRVGLAAAAAFALAVTAGTVATVRQAQIAMRERARAEGRLDDVRQLANTFMFEVHDAIQSLPGSTPARRLLITRVLEYLEKLSRDADAESRLQLEIATAYQKVGNVQGNPYVANIGDAAGAMQSFRKALAISQALVDRDPSPANRASLATSQHLVADMLWAEGSFPDALEHYGRAVALRAALSAADVENEPRRLDLALTHYSLGQTLLRMGDYQGAADAYARSQALLADAVQKNPSNLRARFSFATSTAKLGDVRAVQGDHGRALAYHSEAVVILREVLALDSANTSTKRTIAIMLYRIANDQNETHDFRGAVVTGREALELQNPILEADPSNKQALADTAFTHRVLGEALFGLNQPGEALEHLNVAEKTLKTALADNPTNADNASVLALTLVTRGDVLISLGDAPSARRAYRDATTLLESQGARAETRRYLAMAHEHAGDLERQLGRADPASAALERERAACRHYQQGLEAMRSRSEGTEDPRNVAKAEALSGKLRDCSPRPSS